MVNLAASCITAAAFAFEFLFSDCFDLLRVNVVVILAVYMCALFFVFSRAIYWRLVNASACINELLFDFFQFRFVWYVAIKKYIEFVITATGNLLRYAVN